MIKYEPTDSLFYEANKNYCKTTEGQLMSKGFECLGFCDSFGYEIRTTFVRSNLAFNLRIRKHQSTQNGVVYPVNAIDYNGIEMTIIGLDKKYNVSVGKSGLKRLLTNKKFKQKIPKPYFIRFNYSPEPKFVDNLVKQILDNKISKLKLINGIVICKIHNETIDPMDLIHGIEKVIKGWI